LTGNISLGWSSSAQQDGARAEQLILEALERDTNHSMAHVAMGILRRMQNRLSEAKMEFETAIALDRSNARAIFQLGQTMVWLGQPEAGIPLVKNEPDSLVFDRRLPVEVRQSPPDPAPVTGARGQTASPDRHGGERDRAGDHLRELVGSSSGGTVFRVTLPIASREGAADAAEWRLYVVDDDEAVRDGCRAISSFKTRKKDRR
jgi:hypothetical protein